MAGRPQSDPIRRIEASLGRADVALRRWVRRLGPASVAIALAANIIILIAFVWSRGGQTTRLHIVAHGDEFTAYADGKFQFQASLPGGPAAGGIALIVGDDDLLPSLPQPRGIDSVTVRDFDSGEVLFQDDFDGESLPGRWSRVSGEGAYVQDGTYRSRRGRPELAVEGDWRDVTVDVVLRNVLETAVAVRVTPDGGRVQYDVRPVRHLDQVFTRVQEGGGGAMGASGPLLQTRRSEPIASMLAMLTRPYPAFMLLALASFLVVMIAQFAPLLPGAGRVRDAARWAMDEISPDPDVWARIPRLAPWAAVAVLAAGTLATELSLIWVYGARIPHVPDELSYIFQGKVLASGHLSAPAPPVPNVFDLTANNLIVTHGDKWASLYPFGHPLVLAIGDLFGAMWVAPPVVGALCVVLAFVAGREMFGLRAGLLAALLLAASPFFMMNAANFMSHNTAAFYLLAALALLALSERRHWALAAPAGVALGLVVTTRQMTGIALMPAFALLVAWRVAESWRGTDRRQALLATAAFGAGVAAIGVLYLLYNRAVTGEFFYVDPIQGDRDVLGFGGRHSVAVGIEHEQTQIVHLVLVAHNWPLWIGLMFALLPFLLGTRSKWDWCLLVGAVCAVGVYAAYFHHGFMYGPRFAYESFVLLVLLSASGADRAARMLASAAAAAGRRLRPDVLPAEWASVALVFGFVVAYAAAGWYSWLFGDGGDWASDHMPARASYMRRFNGVDDRLVNRIQDQDLDHALVLVQPCEHWWCLGSVFWMNEPGLDGNVVIGWDLQDHRAQVFQAFPDRYVYLASYAGATLVPFPGVAQPPEASAAQAPRAGDIPTPAPTPSPTPDVNLAARNDQQRRDDLDQIALLLQRYREIHGAYPEALGVQTLCVYDGDVGCALRELLDPLPIDPDPGHRLYRYQTTDDGAFVLYAQMEVSGDLGECPSPLPPAVAAVPLLYCRSGRPPP